MHGLLAYCRVLNMVMLPVHRSIWNRQLTCDDNTSCLNICLQHAFGGSVHFWRKERGCMEGWHTRNRRCCIVEHLFLRVAVYSITAIACIVIQQQSSLNSQEYLSTPARRLT